MSKYYVLDEAGNPVAEPDVLQWAKFFRQDNRQIGHNTIGDVRISTVFLGIGFGEDRPILFETMIFGGPHDQYQERYATRDEAVAGHARAMVLAAGGSIGDQP